MAVRCLQHWTQSVIIFITNKQRKKSSVDFLLLKEVVL